jgi:hypothetical protein
MGAPAAHRHSDRRRRPRPRSPSGRRRADRGAPGHHRRRVRSGRRSDLAGAVAGCRRRASSLSPAPLPTTLRSFSRLTCAGLEVVIRLVLGHLPSPCRTSCGKRRGRARGHRESHGEISSEPIGRPAASSSTRTAHRRRLAREPSTVRRTSIRSAVSIERSSAAGRAEDRIA